MADLPPNSITPDTSTLTLSNGLPRDIVNIINQLTIKQSFETQLDTWSSAQFASKVTVIKYTYGDTHNEFRIKHNDLYRNSHMVQLIIDLLNNKTSDYPIENISLYLSQFPSYHASEHWRKPDRPYLLVPVYSVRLVSIDIVVRFHIGVHIGEPLTISLDISENGELISSNQLPRFIYKKLAELLQSIITTKSS